MATQLEVVANLTFEVTVPGGSTVHGSLHSERSGLVLQVDDPQMFAGRGDAPAIKTLADGLAARGLTIHVHDGQHHLVSIGAIRSPWWQRRLTGSRHIRLGSLRGAWTSARSRSRSVDTPVLPDATMLPPATMLPVAPTFMRRPRRNVTSTDDPHRGGNPRLILAPSRAVGSAVGRTLQPKTFWLVDDVSRIGSGADCDIRLSGLAALHAEIRHDEKDEYVLTTDGPEVRIHGRPTRSGVLRTGSRVEVGGWVLTYYREEYADHGRPFSGRVGGEFGRQRKQSEAKA